MRMSKGDAPSHWRHKGYGGGALSDQKFLRSYNEINAIFKHIWVYIPALKHILMIAEKYK